MAVDIKVHATTGWVKFWIDGVAVIDYSGQTNQGASDFNRVGIGSVSSLVAWADIYIDHWHCDDTTGEGSPAHPSPTPLVSLRPNGDGNYAQWLGSDGNNVNNYLLLDELAPNTTDYIEETVSGDRDSWIFATYTLDAHFTCAAMLGKLSAIDASAGQIAIFNRLGGTDADGANQTLTSAYDLYYERFTTDPGAGSWSQSDIDAFELGVKIP
jgi:hypothetical protein